MRTRLKIRLGLRLAAILVTANLLTAWAIHATPVVSNVHASQRAGTGLVDIYYDLASASNSLTVSLAVSTNSGATFDVSATSVSGDVGSGTTPGTGKHIVWNAGVDLAEVYFPNVKVRIIASDNSLDDGLVAYYPLDGSANDASGNGNNGTVYGATLTTNRFGVPNSAYSFDGTSSRIFINDSPIFVLTNSVTLEAFIDADQQVSSYYEHQIIFRGDDRSGLDPYFMELRGNGTLAFAVDDTNNDQAVVQAPITLNQWHQVAGTLDGTTGQMNLYIDGTLVASIFTKIRPLGVLTGPNPGIGIGDLQSTLNSEYFTGLIGSVRIYNRALSPTEVLQLYDSAQ